MAKLIKLIKIRMCGALGQRVLIPRFSFKIIFIGAFIDWQTPILNARWSFTKSATYHGRPP